MKHLKPYKLFESREVIMAGMKNAMDNKNYQLLVDLIDQHSNLIDYRNIVDEIFDFTDDGNLFLDKPEFASALKYFPLNIRKDMIGLDCYGTGIDTLDGITSLINLTYLDVGVNNLTSLDGIEKLQNLETLSCNDNPLTTLSGIEQLPNLHTLYCDCKTLPTKVKRYIQAGDIESVQNYYSKWK